LNNQLYNYLKAFNAYTAKTTPFIQSSIIINLTAQLKEKYSENISNYTETRVNIYRAINSELFIAVINSSFDRLAIN